MCGELQGVLQIKKINKNVLLVTIGIILVLLSGCEIINRHTYEAQVGLYYSNTLEQEWTDEFTITSVNIEFTSIDKNVYDAANDKNVFTTSVLSEEYYEISIIMFNEEDEQLKLDVEEFHSIDQFNAFGFYFNKDGERYSVKIILKVDGDDYNQDLSEGTLCNGLEVHIHSKSMGYFNFELELDSE